MIVELEEMKRRCASAMKLANMWRQESINLRLELENQKAVAWRLRNDITMLRRQVGCELGREYLDVERERISA